MSEGAHKRRRAWPAFAGALLALATLEIAVRPFYTVDYSIDRELGAIFTPGTTVRWSKEGHGVSHWLDHGVRGGVTHDAHVPRIVALGDSYTEAAMVDDDEVFTAVLQRELERDGVRSDVTNIGRAGLSLADYIHLAPYVQSHLAPRWTIVQVSSRDLGTDAWDSQKQIPNTAVAAFITRRDGGVGVAVTPPHPEGRLTRLLRNVPLMSIRYALVRAKEFLTSDGRQPPLFRAGSVEKKRKVSSDREAPDEPYPIEAELDLLHAAYGGRVTLFYLSRLDAASPSHLGSVEARVLQHCARRGYSCVTIRSQFEPMLRRGRSPFGFANSAFNQGHLNAAGHRIVGEALTRELESLRSRGLF